MKRKILSIFFIILLICSNFIPISNASNYLYLNNLEFYVQINSDGSMNVTEIWDIEDTNTLFKTFETDNEKYSSITGVKVTDITNGANNEFTQINTYMYHVTKNCYYGLINDDGDFEIAWGVGLDNDNEVRKYKIEYKVNDAITKYSDYAELYWQFIGNDFEISADKVQGTIYLPASVNNKENIKVWAHSKDLNGTIYATDLNKVEFEMDNYRSGRYVEVRILFPTILIISGNINKLHNSTILEKAIAEETRWAEEANRQREFNEKMEKAIAIVIIIAAVVLAIYFAKKIFKYKKILKELNGLKPTQELEYYRDLPDEKATPGEAVFLLEKQYASFDIHFSQIFSATLLNLSLKKYIELKVDTNKEDKEAIKIVNLNKEITDLKDDEKEILEFVLKAIGTKEEITMKDLEKYITKHSSSITKLIEKTHKNVKKSMKENKYFDEKEYKKYSNYSGIMLAYIIGAIATIILFPLAIVFIIDAVYCNKIMKKINVLTQDGLDQKEMWKGLKKYMEDFSLLNEREVPELVIWEKYLVYATAFGISEKVLKQLKIVYPNIDELNGTSTSTYMYFMYHSNFNTNFSKAISSSIATATYSSGSGSGGGFSGGGGFGGGGRRRRRKINSFLFELQ